MFKSKIRPIAIPQSEHARLSGYMAYYWGNDQIAPPPIDQTSFALGVTYHDRGYGLIDNMPIGGVDESVWLATQQRGIQTPLTDKAADTVALMHIRRLLTYSDHPDIAPVAALAEDAIATNIPQTSYSRQDYEHADTITRLCDSVSFKFCFEDAGHFEQAVFSNGEMMPIHVQVKAGGHIQLEPWPLSVPKLHAFIIGYELTGYPDHLHPMIVDFSISPQK